MLANNQARADAWATDTLVQLVRLLSGGIRKIRCGVDNRGKSSGARIIYYYAVSCDKILLLDVYAKNEKENLSPNEIRILRREVEEFIR